MSDPVKKVPLLPTALGIKSLDALVDFDKNIIKQLIPELVDHARRINLSLPKDGTEAMRNPMPLAHSTVAQTITKYLASSWEGALLYISDEVGGKTIAFSDGTNWRRVQDRVIVA